MHFTRASSAALAVLLSLSLTGQVAAAPHGLAKRSKCKTQNISTDSVDFAPVDNSVASSTTDIASSTLSTTDLASSTLSTTDLASSASSTATTPTESVAPGPTDVPTDSGESLQNLGLSRDTTASESESKAHVLAAAAIDNSGPVKTPDAHVQPADQKTIGHGKAGLGWNEMSGNRWDQFISLPGSQVGWSYNWASSRNSGDKHPTINYVPMLHGKAVPQEDKPALFDKDKAKFKEWGVTHILSFNEPDQPISAGGCDMTVDEAVQLHQKHFTPELASQYKIGSPAYSQKSPQSLKEWETKCAGACPFDFVNLHFYGTKVDNLKAYLEQAEQDFPGKPLWVTEIGCIDYGVSPVKYCSDDEVKSFMKEAIPLLHEKTERYAWQGSFDSFAAQGDKNNMMEPGSFEINEKGRIFATTV